MTDPKDLSQRRAAVATDRSVIVQAPAGSGKTTLLVERYLGLLAEVAQPEEILAITFTRKAAAEMRARVLEYLDPTRDSAAPHEQAVLAKARAVRERAGAWGLPANPHRLLIRTIDSFNHYLTRTMPVATQLGPVPAPADDAQSLYRLAARRVLALGEGSDPLAVHLRRLLDWHDHRARSIEDLLAAMLGRREQWRRAFDSSGAPQRAQLERVLGELIGAELSRCATQLNDALAASGIDQNALLDALRFAGERCQAEGRKHSVRAFAEATALPDAAPESLPRWQGLTDVLLTQGSEATYRTPKGVNAAVGLKAKTEANALVRSLLEAIGDDQGLAAALHRTRQLPPASYQDDEWVVLDSLIQVLIRSALELELVCAEAGKTDYAGLADAALRGLGDEESGFTDLGLYLDSRIQHLLIDEFQDTNWTQQQLLEKLTAGWEPGDGRTLFLVGDPMQSIYRFREAEVGLFIRNRDHGVGAVSLQALTLQSNFRSRAELVRWVNECIGPAFPARDQSASGAVSFSPSLPGRSTGGAVDLLAHDTAAAEAQAVVATIREALAANATNPDYRAAVIVRARSHLAAIIPALDQAAIPYRAVKLEALLQQAVVRDLLALTRTLLYPGDRTAWLSVLRSPVCGLRLEELLAVADAAGTTLTEAALTSLPEPARVRAQRVVSAIGDAAAIWQQRPLRELVEGLWRRLGGPACCEHPQSELRDAERYLEALSSAEATGLLDDWNDFEESLASIRTEGDPPQPELRLELLTMHGAKGLEWDLVVLPGLDRSSGKGETRLLHWLSIEHRGRQEVLLAPIRRATDAEQPRLAMHIDSQGRLREDNERKRLLYVAATRARERLVLSAVLTAETTEDGARRAKAPAKNSLLNDLWPTVGADFDRAYLASSDEDPDPSAVTAVGTESAAANTLRRLADGWAAAPRPAFAGPRRRIDAEARDIDFNWAGTQARRVGTVLHRLLERIGREGFESLDEDRRARLKARIEPLLIRAGERGESLTDSGRVVRTALNRVFESADARWLLSAKHQDAACELALSGWIDGSLVNGIVDRTFIDDTGQRWIIDYKSGYHDGGDLNAFLEQERSRYQPQLKRYRRLFEQIAQHPVRTALYLARHDRLLEVDTSD